MLLATGALTRDASAQDANDLTRARDAFKQALADEAAGKYDRAAAEFDQARTLAQKETPQVLFHLGVCHAHLGQLVIAREELTRAANRATTEKLDNVATTAKAELEKVAPRIASLTILKPTNGSVKSMTLDRADVTAKLGAAIDVDPGPHDVHVEVSDGPPFDAHFTLGDGEKKSLQVTMATNPADGPPAPPPAPTPAGTPAGAPPPASASASDATPTSGSSSLVGWLLVGGGAAALVGGTVFWVMRSNEINTLNGECGPSQQACPKGAQNDINSGKTDNTVADTLFIVGGAAALAGAGLLVFGGHGSSAPSTAIAPFVTPQSAGIGISGTTW
jgi:hypothetical protein